MAQVYSTLFARIYSHSTSGHDIFIVPGGHKYIVRDVIVNNDVNAAVQARFYVVGETPFYYVAKCPTQYDSVHLDCRWVFNEGDHFAVVCNNAGEIGISVSGYDLLTP